jgi:hypothetical protein
MMTVIDRERLREINLLLHNPNSSQRCRESMCSESSTTTPAMAGALPVRLGTDEAPSTRPEVLASSPTAASGAVLESFNGGPLAEAAALLRRDADADAASCSVSSKRWW